MAIYVTGDTHLPIDIKKLTSAVFESKGLTKNDYVIVCGDFGLIWNHKGMDNEERYWLKWLNEKPWTTLFVDGNHENHVRLANDYKVEEWHGGKVHKLSDSVIHLMRGQVFDIDGYKFFTMGGASSHDKEHRKVNETWWEEELPSDDEYNEALKNLDANNWEVDFVITHCLPDNIQHRIAFWYGHDKLTNFLFIIDKDLKYKHWYCGHYHIDEAVDDKHTILYYSIEKLV